MLGGPWYGKKYLPTLTFTFPTLAFTWYQIRFKKPFVRRLPKLLRMRWNGGDSISFSKNWIGELSKFDICEQSVILFEHYFFPLWSHFLRNFWEASKNKTRGMILILTLALWPGETGVGKSVGIQQFLGSAGDAFAVSWTRVDGWWLVMVGKWLRGQKFQKMYLYCVVLWIAYKI